MNTFSASLSPLLDHGSFKGFLECLHRRYISFVSYDFPNVNPAETCVRHQMLLHFFPLPGYLFFFCSLLLLPWTSPDVTTALNFIGVWSVCPILFFFSSIFSTNCTVYPRLPIIPRAVAPLRPSSGFECRSLSDRSTCHTHCVRSDVSAVPSCWRRE